MADLTADFELGTNGNTIAITDPGSATAWDSITIGTGAALTYSSTQKYETLAAHGVTTGFAQVRLQWNFSEASEHYGRIYIYPVANWLADVAFITPQRDTTRQGYIAIGADNKISLYNIGAVLQATSTNGLTQNSWNRVEWYFKHDNTTGAITAKLFLGLNADGTTPDETVSVTDIDTYGAGLPTSIVFGLYTNQNNRDFYLDNIVATATDWPGPWTEAAVGREYKRFYGPAQLAGTAATLYTVPAGKRARIRLIHVSNPSAGAVDYTLSVGADAAGTRMWDDYAIAADSTFDHRRKLDLAAGESIQGFAGSAATLAVTISGWEEPA